jgi:nicotinamide-nucleotide amidase
MLLYIRLKILSVKLFRFLLKKQLTVSFAESCTGGLLSKCITDIPGSSKIFPGSVISYSNELKINLLDIDRKIIEKHGAVSEETAEKMSDGIKKITGSDISAGITGIAGPDGGTAEKPAGTVCFGFNIINSRITCTKHFSGNRRQVRYKSACFAIETIISKII